MFILIPAANFNIFSLVGFGASLDELKFKMTDKRQAY